MNGNHAALVRDDSDQGASRQELPMEAAPPTATRPRRAPVRTTRNSSTRRRASRHTNRVLLEIKGSSLALETRRARTDDAEAAARFGAACGSRLTPRGVARRPRPIAPLTRRVSPRNHAARALARARTKLAPPDAPNRLDTLSRSIGAPSRCIVPGMQNRYLSSSRSIPPRSPPADPWPLPPPKPP
jgi:hypothetical protein